MTQTLNEEDIKKALVMAYNEMIRNRDGVLTNLEKVLGEVTSEESVDKRIAEAKDWIEKTAQDVEALIYSTLGKEGEDLR